jgi:hypothetical protein
LIAIEEMNMLKSADAHVARYLMKQAFLAPGAASSASAIKALLHSMIAPALIGGGLGGVTGMLTSEDSPVSSGLLGALGGAGLGALGGAAGGILGGHVGRRIPRLSRGQKVPDDIRAGGGEKAELLRAMGPDTRKLLHNVGLSPASAQTDELLAQGLGTLGGGAAGAGLGGLLAGSLAG